MRKQLQAILLAYLSLATPPDPHPLPPSLPPAPPPPGDAGRSKRQMGHRPPAATSPIPPPLQPSIPTRTNYPGCCPIPAARKE